MSSDPNVATGENTFLSFSPILNSQKNCGSVYVLCVKLWHIYICIQTASSSTCYYRLRCERFRSIRTSNRKRFRYANQFVMLWRHWNYSNSPNFFLRLFFHWTAHVTRHGRWRHHWHLFRLKSQIETCWTFSISTSCNRTHIFLSLSAYDIRAYVLCVCVCVYGTECECVCVCVRATEWKAIINAGAWF